MKTAKLEKASPEKVESTSLDNETLEFWAERARIQLAAMGAIATWLD